MIKKTKNKKDEKIYLILQKLNYFIHFSKKDFFDYHQNRI